MKKSKEYSRREFLQFLGLTALGGVITSCSPELPGLNQPLKINPTNTPAYNPSIGENLKAEGDLESEPTPTAYPQNGKLTQDKIDFLTQHEVKEGDNRRPVVMMTYDDVGTFKQVGMILKAYKRHPPSKATFFFTGEKILPSAKVVQAIIDDGHILGCHSWSHRAFSKLRDEEINREIERCFVAIDKVVPGYKFQFIRFPYGDSVSSPRVLRLAAQYGLQHIYWTMGSNGLIKSTKNTIASHVKNGSIVISHMFRYYDVNQAEDIVSTLIDKGFSLESVKTGRKPADIYPGERP